MARWYEFTWEDAWDNLMRIKSHQVAAELLEIAWGENIGE